MLIHRIYNCICKTRLYLLSFLHFSWEDSGVLQSSLLVDGELDTEELQTNGYQSSLEQLVCTDRPMAKRLIRGGFSNIRLYVFKSGLSSLLVGVENCPGVRSKPLLWSKGRTPGKVVGGVGLGHSVSFFDSGDPLWIR